MKRVNLFLGGVINISNAQNNNCKSLIRYLDHKKFNFYTLQSSRAPIIDAPGVRFMVIKKPVFFWKYIAFAWGLWKCDIAYLPKTECMFWTHLLSIIFRKKYFRTVESIIQIPQSANILLKPNRTLLGYRMTRNLYSITEFMIKYNFSVHGLVTSNKVLYLGVDKADKSNLTSIIPKPVTNVVLIGHDLVRKGVFDYLELSSKYKDICFHLIGSGNGKIDLRKIIDDGKDIYQNVIYHGPLGHIELQKFLESQDIDLLILPSKSEGFPKVILECASYGIPSMVFNDYGASEWLTNYKDGFICNDLDEMAFVLNRITKNIDLLLNIKLNAFELYKHFTWEERINVWEDEILSLSIDEKS